MKKLIVILSLFVLLQGALYAQDTPKFGIGTDINLASPGSNVFYFPIVITPNFAMEPEIAYATSTSKSDPKESGVAKITNESTLTQIGTGLFYRNYGETFGSYFGARLGLFNTSTTSKNENTGSTEEEKTIGNGNYIAPAMGAEYLFSKNFGMGGEFQYAVYNTTGEGTDSLTGQKDVKTDITESSSGLVVKAMLRWYF